MSTPLYQDDVDVLYRLEKSGWSTLFFHIGDRIHEIGITHLFGDPIADIIDWCQALAAGNEQHTIRFNDEPGTTWLSFCRLASHQHIARVALYQVADVEFGGVREDNLIAEAPILRGQLALQLFMQLEKTSLLCRDRRYASTRSDFPYLQFTNLQNLMTGLRARG